MGVAVLIILAILSYIVGCAVLRSMNVIMIGSLSSILLKPFTVGATVLFIGFCIIMFIIKGIGLLLGWLFSLIIFCAPIVAIIGLIVVIVKIIKNKK